MTWDLDETLDAASADRGEPCLVEVARAHHGAGAATRCYFWSTGRICATVGSGRIRIRRRYGTIGSSRRSNTLRLDRGELGLLRAACRDWLRRRERWAAFYYSCAGFPAGFGRACYYQAPGKRGQLVTVGRFTPGGTRGEDLRGKDEVVRLPTPRWIAEGVRHVGEIWRRGERYGPAAGSLVGLRYRLGDRLTVDARREGARVWRRGGSDVHLEPDEEPFVAALLDVTRRGA